MRLSRSVVLSQSIAAAFLIVGCQPQAKPPVAPPPPAISSADQAAQVQVDIKAFAPDAHIARVQQVSKDDQLAAVLGLTDKEAKVGDVVSVLDASQKVIANGTVDSIYKAPGGEQSVVIKYDIAADGGRAPMPGDLVVTQLPTH